MMQMFSYTRFRLLIISSTRNFINVMYYCRNCFCSTCFIGSNHWWAFFYSVELDDMFATLAEGMFRNILLSAICSHLM